MKFRSSIIIVLLSLVFFVGAFYPQNNPREKEQMILYTVINLMDQLHFSPKALDDDYSEKVFESYLKYIDGGKRFLLQEDIDQLAVYKYKIDDQAKAQTFQFFDLSVEILDRGMDRAEEIYNELITQPFDFNSNETFEFDDEKREYPKSRAELKDHWRKILTYEGLKDYDDLKEKYEENGETKSEEQLEIEAREKVKELFDEVFKNLAKLRRSDRFEMYVSSLTHLFDPHSDYFNPKEKEDFDIRMGGRLEGIGARLQTDGDYTKVVSIVPGGPAWKGKLLEVDDLIYKVSQRDSEDQVTDEVDIQGMRIDDVVGMIRGDKGTVVILTVKKPSGEMIDIEIEREEVIIADGNAKSLILNLEGSIGNVGYILLPSFYADFERKDGRSSAVHVKQEIKKLKDQGVNGIILDLRDNLGGSLRDVVQMSGLFIEEGPIVQVKPRDRKAYVYEDEDEEVKYDGPLIVMVNSFSASASEILAAALQDYGRAVVVGSKSTFGKGTVQRFFDLDRAIRGNADLKPLGQVKMTTQKYYRVNGGSVQLKGVEPDIVFPDNFSYIKMGEKIYENPMEWSEIEPVTFGQDIVSLQNINKIKLNSKTRIESHDTFKKIDENAKRIKRNRDNSSVSLNFEVYKKDLEARLAEADKYKGLYDNVIPGLKAENLEVDLDAVNLDESTKALNDEWIKSISKDIYLEETLKIMKDLTESSN